MFRMNVFFLVLKWAWRGWELKIDLEEGEEDSLKGMQITIGDYEAPKEVEE